MELLKKIINSYSKKIDDVSYLESLSDTIFHETKKLSKERRKKLLESISLLVKESKVKVKITESSSSKILASIIFWKYAITEFGMNMVSDESSRQEVLSNITKLSGLSSKNTSQIIDCYNNIV